MIIKKLTEFKLNAFFPYVPELLRSVETGTVLSGILPWIDAKVPGSVYRDLISAGIIRDPYYEMQSHEAEWASRPLVDLCDGFFSGTARAAPIPQNTSLRY